MFDSGRPQISARRFKKYDWQDFYREAKEDIPHDIPDPLRLPVDTFVFVDSDLGGNKVNRKSRTGILIFVNKAPIYWYSNRLSVLNQVLFKQSFMQ